ncbi:sigma-54 interaction domain-containing protein [Desulfogranum mediterraneum]|uniref:sigma-54 interaction domain-containing protein n=1 Tax=Desulfogranum mediterraneum TaxID=160661 RepID=UPI000686A258|nr:sigma 54-interacting transcriptional regulator [Desulfogranum mediterraneum]
MTLDKPTYLNTQDEVDRLATNWRTLLDTMPELVFLLDEGGCVEYMNRSAKLRFGESCSEQLIADLRAVGTSCFRNLGKEGERGEDPAQNNQMEAMIDSVPVEFAAVPFVGYSGEQLLMLVLRDITERKAHEQELLLFNTNIEDILQSKITELQESEETRQRLSRQVNSLKSQLGHRHRADKMIGSSSKMREMREMIHQVAGSDATILITGESGTGKELAANLIKGISSRDDKPFLKINCNAINDSILESDLFGYEKGAFTGATSRKVGKFEIVNHGSIFLDEIGDISPRMQASLLRVLQNGEILRVGGTEPVKVDVRVIAATNVDLGAAVKEKKFRLDLYYRLNIINIDMPPLRERKEDIVELVSHFVNHYRDAFKKDIDFVPKSIINRLLLHDWPGNVRELENLIQRAVLMAKGKMITEKDLFFDQNLQAEEPLQEAINLEKQLGSESLKSILAGFESEVITQALKKYGGNVATAAASLKVGKTALYDKMKRYEISAKQIKKSI